ncbi:MAG: DUF5906 domain-containing protein [Bacteroidales bacterium]|nr:DUF5906 domain-containing protein [Bacteroidales bacterium]
MTKSEYVRVGTTYYKMVNQPQLRGGSVRKRIPWSVETLRQDHGKNFIVDIPKYDGFCTVPSHKDYREEIDNFLNRREDTERLKNLSTALTYKVEAKGKDRYEVPFYTKFVLCSNNERNPVLIDAEETRFWVRKVSRLESDDTQFLYKLKAEIPAFLFWLSNRQLSTEQENRMWFRPSFIHTAALDKIIRNNRSRVEIDMCEQILEVMNEQNIGEFSFCINDLLPLWENTRHKVERYQVRVVVQDFWKLTPAPNAYTYVTYETAYLPQLTYKAAKWTGRYYKVTRAFLETLC